MGLGDLLGRASYPKTGTHFSAKRLGLRQIAGAVLIAPIRFYRYWISPLLPPSCRFTPTCSQYAIEAIQVHGPLKGSYLMVRRLLRCHPIRWLGGSQGYDPVPPR